jgi:hypothetical protein
MLLGVLSFCLHYFCTLSAVNQVMLFGVCCSYLFSSSGNPLQTSAFIVENVFAIAIGAISLILFAQLIGKMQVNITLINSSLLCFYYLVTWRIG